MKFPKSYKAHHRALEMIPLGSQTFSKSYLQWPETIAPLFLNKGEGATVWDIDGNSYTDFVNGLLSVSLGYCDPDINKAVIEQVQKGTIFSLNSELEADIAQKIIDRVPCAEMVRFGKNGSDATSGAIRIARSFTGRDKVAVCGYHGWQDWYIGSTSRNKGVPNATKELTHSFAYNDISSLESLCNSHEYAAIILEPMNIYYPQNNFLENVQALAKENGALLIFDETITGFRLSRGGAQELFGVIPDLATFGKGVANGFPLSLIAGQKKYMRECEDIFFSFTMGGETLSLAAAGAVMDKIDTHKVLDHISYLGTKLKEGVSTLIIKHGCADFIQIEGHPSWSFLLLSETANISMWDIKTYFLDQFISRGILWLGTHNLSYAHSEEDISKLLSAYDEILPVIKNHIDKGTLQTALPKQRIKPVFTVR